MKNLWAPWRAEYILSPKSQQQACLFCEAPAREDSLVIKKAPHCFALMNRFPYTTGHCLVAPYRHLADLTDLDANESGAMMELVRELIEAIRTAMHPDGFNVGCNLGSVAGAGIEDHLHIHIVPRWKGDTNFIPVISEVHLISEHLLKTRDKIRESLPA